MAAYTTRLRPDYTAGRVDVPDVGGIFLDFADRQMKQHQIGLDNAMQQAKMEEDKRRYETELGFRQRNEQRVMDELNRAQATREGVLATLDPKAYQGAKMADMENQMRAGLANLSPQDRAEAEKQWAANFNRGATGEYVNRLATTNANVDPSALLSAQVSMQNKALNDPTSELYKAKQLDEWNQKKREYDYKHGLDMAKVNAQKASEQADMANMLKMLNIDTTKTINRVEGQQEAQNITNMNDKIAKKQEAYGNAYVQAYNSNPNAKPEELDLLARRTIGITTDDGNITDVIPLAEVPKLTTVQTKVNKDAQEYARDVIAEAGKGKVTANTVGLADSLIKSYKAGIEANKEGKSKQAVLNDYKNLIDTMGGDSSKVATEEGAKAQIKALEARMKNGSKGESTKDSTPVLKAAIATKIGDDTLRLLTEEANKRKIPPKEFATMLELGDNPGDTLPTWDTTQRENVLKYMDMLYPVK